MEYFAKNLKLLRKLKDISQEEMSHQLGFSRTGWNNYENSRSKPGLEDLIKISNYFGIYESQLLHIDLPEAYTEGNLISIINGSKKYKERNLKGNLKGNLKAIKYENNSISTVANDSGNGDVIRHRMPQVITIDTQGNENVVMVPVRARAGYLSGYSDPTFIEKLPAYRLPGLSNGTYRLFEVDGLSMYPTLHGGDLIIGQNVEQLQDVRDDRVHVIITKNDGIVVKRVLNRIKKDNKLILKSDNYKDRDMYPSIVTDPVDVIEIWYAIGFISRQMRPPAEVYNRVIDLEGRLTIMEDNLKKQK